MDILNIKDKDGNWIGIPAIKGATGDKGNTGEKGEKGDRGKKGDTPIINVTATANDEVIPVTKSGTTEHPIFHFKFDIDDVKGDGKVKMNADTDAKYLKELLDNSTIVVKNGKAVVAKLEGQIATIAEVNFLKGAKSNIQDQLDILSGVTSVYGVFNTKADLDADTGDPEDGQMALIRHDEQADDKQTSYVYLKNTWEILAEVSMEVRNFEMEPIDLTSEVTGILPKENIDTDIARKEDFLDKATYGSDVPGAVLKAKHLVGQTVGVEDIDDAVELAHEHENKDILDEITNAGDGDKFLSDKGTYRSIPLNDGMPIGMVNWFGGDNAPTGWLVCNGQAVSRTQYDKLFEVIGTKFGAGDGSTTFNLPNLIDKFIQGSTTVGTNKAAGLPNITGRWPSTYVANNGPNAVSYGGWSNATNAVYSGGYINGRRYWPAVGSSTDVNNYDTLAFNASRSNGIYGRSTTVQPPAVTLLPCIKAVVNL